MDCDAKAERGPRGHRAREHDKAERGHVADPRRAEEELRKGVAAGALASKARSLRGTQPEAIRAI